MLKCIYLESVKIEAADKSEILNLIEPDVLTQIKAKDPHPFFQLYSFAHEGISRPRVVGEEPPPMIEWPRKAIESIKNIIMKGVKLFKNHLSKKETGAQRKVIGEIVASQQKEIDGKLHHLIVTYHSPEVREEAEKCDACSQEADWDFIPQAGKWIADKINKVKAVAGLNSKEDRPAFAGAVRLAAIEAEHIYCKDDPGEGDPPGRETGERNKMELGTIKFNVLKAHLLEERNAKPSDLFKEDDLKQDRNFAVLFTNISDRDKKIEELTKQIETLETEKSEAAKKELAATAKGRAEKLIEEMKIENDIIKNKIIKLVEDNPETDNETLKENADTYIAFEKQLKQSLEDKTQVPGKGEGKPDKLDLTDPKNNPFLRSENE